MPSLLVVNAVTRPGGAEIIVLRLLTGLLARGWEATMAAPGDGPLFELARAQGLGTVQLAVGGLARGRGSAALASFPQARRLAGEYDVVYLNGTVAGRLLPAVAGRARTVLHVHDMVERVPSFWRLADVIVCESEAVAARLPGLDARAVGAPVDPDPPALDPPWPPGGGPVIGYVGRIEPRKGVIDLVHAAPLIKGLVPGARIVLVGDDSFDADPAYLEAVRSAPDVEHYGWVDGAASLMRHLDVLVVPSHAEPLGAVLPEAMVVGTPVVATRVDGIPEVVEDGRNGRLVEPGDPAGLAAAVQDVLERRAELSANARVTAARFHTDVYVERVAALIAPPARH